MDDDYVLVSKDEVSKLKAEIVQLKKELKEKPDASVEPQIDVNELVSNLVQVLHEESQRERELILQNLNEIKDINKSTLDNLLTNTQKLDGQLEEMIDTISGLVENLSTIVTKFSKDKEFNVDELIKKIKENSNVEIDEKLLQKLDEIDVFMKNLRILLSYVKPNDLKIEK